MRRSERRNNLQICLPRDSNTGGSYLWYNTLPLDHGGARLRYKSTKPKLYTFISRPSSNEKKPVLLSCTDDVNYDPDNNERYVVGEQSISTLCYVLMVKECLYQMIWDWTINDDLSIRRVSSGRTRWSAIYHLSPVCSMGCTTSVHVSNVLHTQTDTARGFTSHQKHVIIKTWRMLSNDLNGRGARIFLRIFRLNPEVKKLFPCGHLDGDELVKDPVFKGHATRFMQAVGAVIDNIDDYEQALLPLLNSLGRQHIHFRGFRYEQFDAFEEAMMYVWEEDLGSRFTPETREAWHKVFRFLMDGLRQGYQDALRDAGLERPPWEDEELQEKKQGPEFWEKFCHAVRFSKLGQSPIDIQPEEAQKACWPRLRIDFKRDRCVKIVNNGHSVQVVVRPPDDLGDMAQYSVRRGPLKDERYVLDNFHFHWGRNDEEGSEHTINGVHLPAEAHFVCYNMKYGSLKEAQDKTDGICVLATLYRLGRPNRYLQHLIDSYFEGIKYKSNGLNMEGIFHPKNLIPRRLHRQKFWYYHGSLTTPPCYESVEWIVFQKLGHISPEQLQFFRNLSYYCPHCGHPDSSDEDEGRLTHNFRPVQPRRFVSRNEDGDEEEVDRPLYTYFRRYRRTGQFLKEEGDDESSASSSSSSEDEDSSEGEEEED
ncbi:hypothetical protein LSH36_491g05001 [Paralvinella palmiformis]|uniref:carbonic anhydrase n=1 Tax=Paralvinella palmiformis TaxID=53620 RepID=A0AAD9J9S6_9ANNE|nr:hypothetical protein LSH36_491g05001 [Paralvinella palmiformis]